MQALHCVRRLCLVLAPVAWLTPALAASPADTAFQQESKVAMDRMMAGMDVKPSGDVDRDFALMMIAHHQGAIDMAEAELRHGRNEQLRRIARDIVVEQQQQIAAMRLAVGLPASAPSAAPAPMAPMRHGDRP